ncbi:MAG: YodC family protein [Stenotrophomonas sp.]|uniref:YodC family protein n=1 Tax=Stenotrophomonas sp. TaxID=69392 RepID=UPI003D6CFEB9
MDFKAGDVVKLKSGSLPMTIAWIKDGEAWCEWFDTKSEPQGRRFSLVLLTR